MRQPRCSLPAPQKLKDLRPRPCHAFYLSPTGCRDGEECQYSHAYILTNHQRAELRKVRGRTWTDVLHLRFSPDMLCSLFPVPSSRSKCRAHSSSKGVATLGMSAYVSAPPSHVYLQPILTRPPNRLLRFQQMVTHVHTVQPVRLASRAASPRWATKVLLIADPPSQIRISSKRPIHLGPIQPCI